MASARTVGASAEAARNAVKSMMGLVKQLEDGSERNVLDDDGG